MYIDKEKHEIQIEKKKKNPSMLNAERLYIPFWYLLKNP